MPQHLAFALTEPTFGKKAQEQGMGVAARPTVCLAGLYFLFLIILILYNLFVLPSLVF
jgi:hypothetical protein